MFISGSLSNFLLFFLPLLVSDWKSTCDLFLTLDPERNPTGVVNIEPQNKIKIIKKRVKIEINKEKKKKIKKKEGKKGREKTAKEFDTQYSRGVSHRSTDWASSSLTSEF